MPLFASFRVLFELRKNALNRFYSLECFEAIKVNVLDTCGAVDKRNIFCA